MSRTRNFLLLYIFLQTVLFAGVKEIDYRGTFGIFGTVGTIKNRIERKEKSYRIETTVTLAGMAKMLLGGQTERYLSKGHIENGLMVTDYYRMVSRKKGKVTTKEYIIDHRSHSVVKRYKREKGGKVLKSYTKKLDFYAKDDLLTLYFNMDRHIRDHQGQHRFRLKAVGLEKQKGIVQITVATPKEVPAYKEDLGKSASWYAKALIVQKNFRKKKGDILLSADTDGYIRKAVIKDILLYGDAQLERVK